VLGLERRRKVSEIDEYITWKKGSAAKHDFGNLRKKEEIAGRKEGRRTGNRLYSNRKKTSCHVAGRGVQRKARHTRGLGLRGIRKENGLDKTGRTRVEKPHRARKMFRHYKQNKEGGMLVTEQRRPTRDKPGGG